MDRYLSRIGRLMVSIRKSSGIQYCFGLMSTFYVYILKEVMQEDNDDEEDAQEAAVQHDEGGRGTQEFPEEEAYPNVIFDAELNVYRLA
uniref:Uncharacterized protein n=1 Tax=Ditylenchus dipsaci TaxID=166011 RepID=A0A915E972_9BILA